MFEDATQQSIDNKFNVISATVTNAGPPDTPEAVKKRMIETNNHWAENSDFQVGVFSRMGGGLHTSNCLCVFLLLRYKKTPTSGGAFPSSAPKKPPTCSNARTATS